MQNSQDTINLILSTAALISLVISVYNAFRNPQIKSDLTSNTLKGDITDLQKQVQDIRETHLRTVENDIKNLTSEINRLALTVERLSTIINERIPRGSPNLTPPGV